MSTSSSMTELQRMTKDELRREITSKRSEYAKVRLHVQAQGEKNHAKMKLMRRDIARMMTALGSMPEMAKTETATKKVEKETSKTVKKPVKASSRSPKKK
jgi:ribosomal protein L29